MILCVRIRRAGFLFSVCVVFIAWKAKYCFGCSYNSEIYLLVNYKNEYNLRFLLYSGGKETYNSGMNNEQIKAAIKAKGYTLKAFAEVLGVSYDAFRQSLASSKPLTEQLRRHILLALQSDTPQQPGTPAAGVTLPPEMWNAIDTAAENAGTTPEKYTARLMQDLAKDISHALIIGRKSLTKSRTLFIKKVR